MARQANTRPKAANGKTLIAGVPPWEYAAQWGDGATRDGCRFYNVSDQCRVTGRSKPRTDWPVSEWVAFVKAVGALRGGIVARLKSKGARVPASLGTLCGWAGEEYVNLDDLLRLERWAVYMLEQARNGGTWQSRV